MGTRSVIAEPNGDGFRGRYHHWDGYPSGVGQTLWGLYALLVAIALAALALTAGPGADQPATSPDPMTYTEGRN